MNTQAQALNLLEIAYPDMQSTERMYSTQYVDEAALLRAKARLDAAWNAFVAIRRDIIRVVDDPDAFLAYVLGADAPDGQP